MWSYEIQRYCQAGANSNGIFADRTKIQNDQNILDTCSAKPELISPKRSEKYSTQAEVVNGTNPDSRITVREK